MVLALKDKWIWDFWLYRDGEQWHCWFLQADKSLGDSELRHRSVTIGHAVSRDLRSWDYLGTCLEPSAGPGFDDWTTWTGSVVKDEAGLWHLFYTGTSHADDGMRQRIGHATSRDGHAWVRVGDGLCLDLTGGLYEEYSPGHWHDRAMRDPCVIRDPQAPGWLMFFTARVPGRAEPNAGGAIGLARSADLHTWTLEQPVYAGGDFGQLEVPQVLAYDGRWYCVFCTAAEHWSSGYRAKNPQAPVTGSHYLMAADPLGPWDVASSSFFDGAMPCRRYSAKVLATDAGLVTLSFLWWDESGRFVGEISDPLPVAVDANGLLSISA